MKIRLFVFAVLSASVVLGSGELPPDAGVVVPPMTRAMWNQGRHFNLMCPTTATGGNDGRMWAGCTAVAAAIILDYYQWPLQGAGDTKYNECYWPANSINLRARFDDPYDWESIRETYGHIVSARESQAIGTLMSDVGAALNMNYGPDGSEAMAVDIQSVFGRNFSFDNSHMQQITDFNDEGNVAMIQMQLMAGHPIPCSGAVNDADSGHTYVCDGYATTSPTHGVVTNLYHFNFGWGGLNNGWYPLDAVFTSALPGGTASAKPVVSMYLGVYPKRAPQFARLPEVVPPSVKAAWHFATCWTNYLEGITLERQRRAMSMVNEKILPSDWFAHEVSPGDTVGWVIGQESVSGRVVLWWGSPNWPGAGNALCSTKGVPVSDSTTVTIKYRAMKLPSGVSLRLTTCLYDDSTVPPEWSDMIPNTFDYCPSVCTLAAGTSDGVMTERTAVINGSDIVATIGGDSSEVHFAIKVVDENYGTPGFAANTEIFRLESFDVSGEAEDWQTEETRNLSSTAREAAFDGLDEGVHRLKLTARFADGDEFQTQEINVSSTVRVPTVTVVETNAMSVVFEVADAASFGYGFEYQSNALNGIPSVSGNRITWTFNNALPQLGTHWLTLAVSNKVNGLVSKYVHITNPPEDHPLCSYTEKTVAAAVERAKQEHKLVFLLSTGDPEASKFEKVGEFLRTNTLVSVIADKYVFVEASGAIPSDSELVRGYWKQQSAKLGETPAAYSPQTAGYAFIIDPNSPDHAVECEPTAYGGLNSQRDFKFMSVAALVVPQLESFLAQDFGIEFGPSLIEVGGKTAYLPSGASAAVMIPHDWLVANGLLPLGADDSGVAAAMNATYANDCTGWESYVADLTPTNELSRLLAFIRMEGGTPVVEWNITNSAAAELGYEYRVLGSADLHDDWSSADFALHRFFKVVLIRP